MDQDQAQGRFTRQLTGQVVHARKCYKRLFFIDLRIDDKLKCTVLFRSDDTRQCLPCRLSDLELASRWKKIRCGDIIKLKVFEASEEESAKRDHDVYQATDFVLHQTWPRNDRFPPEPAMGLKLPIAPKEIASGPTTLPPTEGSWVEPSSESINQGQENGISSWQDYCKFWINSQKCLKKDCRKRHPTGTEFDNAQEMWVRERTQARKERSTLQDDPHSISSKLPHSQRAFIFCRWLVNKFGKEYLNSGSGILDVAGGKGEISLFLTHMFGIRSTVVEPNMRRDKPYRRRNLMDVIKRQLDIEAGGDGQFFRVSRPSYAASSCLNIEDGAKSGADAEEIESRDSETIKEHRRLKKLRQSQFDVPRLSTLLGDRFAEEHSGILEGASILIGMHPDQATEPIVAMALKHGKPFAVVPCCVFAHENPQRRLLSGGEVNTTVEFVQYLMEKASSYGANVKKEFLPFDGMNIVVFCTADCNFPLHIGDVPTQRHREFQSSNVATSDSQQFKTWLPPTTLSTLEAEPVMHPYPISMTHSAYDKETTVPPTTMSEAVNAVNAAIVAAVAAGDNTTAFTTEGRAHDLDTPMESVEAAAASATSRLKRPAEDDAEDIDDSVKLRKLQEEVNNNANAAAGILPSNSSVSNNTSSHSSKHNSSRNSPNRSATAEAHASDRDSSKEKTPETSQGRTSVGADTNAESGANSGREHGSTNARASPVAQETVTTATTTHLTATSHSSIMADLERMQQLAKIDPAQLASYSTNPNNQATLEQLTSSALANVLAQAPLTVSSLQSNLQLQQEHEQQHEQQQNAVQGILASMPASTENAPANDSASSNDDDTLNGKRTSSRNMTNDERRQRRLLRNRVAAKECRKKKKAYVNELQDTCARLQEENARLYKEVEELNAKLTLGAMRIDENVRLIKEVEELSAKLTLGVMGGGSAQAHVHETISAASQAASKLRDGANAQKDDEQHTDEPQTRDDQRLEAREVVEVSTEST
ncbi:hypothetical protein BGX26_010311 [Mortierella sp. AD094]|nr:hypothetical protein BGX26_010311 [Mortierella sp. AD094]